MTDELDNTAAYAPPNGLSLLTRVVDDVVIVTVADAVDANTAPELGAAIDQALDSAPPALVVDLTAVTFLASAGMTVLMKGREQAGSAVGFAVVADGPATARPLRVLGLDDELALCATLDEALRRLT
mgnify:CR=1 FL=1